MLVSLSVDDPAPNWPALRLFIISVSAFLFIFQPCAICTFQPTFHMFPVPLFPLARPSHILPTLPPPFPPSLPFPHLSQDFFASHYSVSTPMSMRDFTPSTSLFLSLSLIASAMYYPYFSVIMQYDERLRRPRRSTYHGDWCCGATPDRIWYGYAGTPKHFLFFSVPDIC
jgi:hypothetical protein